MEAQHSAAGVSDWASKSGSVWARRWRDTDAGLAGLAPHLLSAIAEHAPNRPFKAFDIGCGPGSTTIDVAAACPDAEILACDISPDLAEIARRRTANLPRVQIVGGNAEEVAGRGGPFDLFFSRHGVMFFADPVGAFKSFRAAANPGSSLVFSCFQSWQSNPWASEVAAAAAGRVLPAPGREPSGFAFADPDYVREILASSGWVGASARDVEFDYVAGEGCDAVDAALDFFTELGPSSRLLEPMTEGDRRDAVKRMRGVIERHFEANAVTFTAAAWIWSAKVASS